jgi:hypothetical protein
MCAFRMQMRAMDHGATAATVNEILVDCNQSFRNGPGGDLRQHLKGSKRPVILSLLLGRNCPVQAGAQTHAPPSITVQRMKMCCPFYRLIGAKRIRCCNAHTRVCSSERRGFPHQGRLSQVPVARGSGHAALFDASVPSPMACCTRCKQG